MSWFVVDAAKFFAEKGHDVSYICNMDDNFIRENEEYAHCIPVGMERGLLPLNMLRSMLELYRIFKRERFDVVQYATPNASFIGSIAAKCAHVPYRIYAFWGMRYEGFSGWKRILFMMLEKKTCALSTHVRIVSPKNMEIVVRDGVCPQEKIGVIGLGGTIGVNTNVYDISKKLEWRKEIRNQLHISDQSKVFCFVGRINADKGINELIDAFREVEHRCTDVKLLLVGMEDTVNPITPENMRWARNNESVILNGPVHKDLVCRYIAASDVLVHPTYREGFGKILQEAMAMRLPIITTDIPGPSEVIEENVSGLLVPKADATALADAMIRLYDDNSLADSLAQAGYERLLQNFTMEKMVANIYNEYSRITKLC